jgi:hypothetical protein
MPTWLRNTIILIMKTTVFLLLGIFYLVVSQHMDQTILSYPVPGTYILEPVDYNFAEKFNVLLIGGGAAGSGFPNVNTDKLEGTGGGSGSMVVATVYTNQTTFYLTVGAGGQGIFGDYGEDGESSILTNDLSTIILVAGGGDGANNNLENFFPEANNGGIADCGFSELTIHCDDYNGSSGTRINSFDSIFCTSLEIPYLLNYGYGGFSWSFPIGEYNSADITAMTGFSCSMGGNFDTIIYPFSTGFLLYPEGNGCYCTHANNVANTYYGGGGGASGDMSCCDTNCDCSDSCTYYSGCNGADGVVKIYLPNV